MRKFLVVLSLFISACLPVIAGDRWENATRDEIWLQDPDMYSPRFEVNKTLPNGYKLLYKETGLGDYAARRNLSMSDYADRHLDLDLVKIKSPEGRIFMGLAEPQKDGNYMPIYGVIDGKEAVLYDYDINFKQLPLPKNLTGTWYAPQFRMMFEDADTHWKETHGGKENKYPAHGFVDNGNKFDFLFLPYTEEDYLTFGAKPEYQFSKSWAKNFDRMGLGEVTITKSNGRKKSMAQETGGYIIDSYVDKWYSMSYDWKPETGSLTLKFGPKIRTEYKVDWHNWEGPKDAYNDNDFKNVNPGAAHMRVEVPKWAQLSPDNVWGQITVKVYAVTDRFMIVSGKSVKAGWDFTEVWANEDYEGGLLTTNRRKEIVEHLLDRCVRVRNMVEQNRRAEAEAAAKKSASDAMIQENVELMNSKWAPFLCEVFQAYRDECVAIKDKLGKYFSGDFSNSSGGIEAAATAKLEAKLGKEAYREGDHVCYSFISELKGNVLNTIAECENFGSYFSRDGEVSFIVDTPNGLKKFAFPANFKTSTAYNGEMEGQWIVNGQPTLTEPTEIMLYLDAKRKTLESLDPQQLKDLKKQYPKEFKALEKTPKNIKGLSNALEACNTLAEYLK